MGISTKAMKSEIIYNLLFSLKIQVIYTYIATKQQAHTCMQDFMYRSRKR